MSNVWQTILLVLRSIVNGDEDWKITRSMAQAVKSVASKAAQIASAPASVLRQFPPKEAVFNASSPTYFSPEVWANLQKPPPSALTSFAHRIGLANVIRNDAELLQASTHLLCYSRTSHRSHIRANSCLHHASWEVGIARMDILRCEQTH